jgi:hypothetical protein
LDDVTSEALVRSGPGKHAPRGPDGRYRSEAEWEAVVAELAPLITTSLIAELQRRFIEGEEMTPEEADLYAVGLELSEPPGVARQTEWEHWYAMPWKYIPAATSYRIVRTRRLVRASRTRRSTVRRRSRSTARAPGRSTSAEDGDPLPREVARPGGRFSLPENPGTA